MQISENTFLEYIHKFEDSAKEAIQIMVDEFGTDFLKKKIPKRGTVTNNNRSLEYRFHGSSCEFIFSGSIVDVLFFPENKEHINFSAWTLYQFIRSSGNGLSDITEEVCIDWMKKLESQDYIKLNSQGYTELPAYYGVYTLA